MKKLSQFVSFDWDSFADGKVFEVTAINSWVDYNHPDSLLGTVVEVVIIEDHTIYPPTQDGSCVSNRYEKLRWMNTTRPQGNMEECLRTYCAKVNRPKTQISFYELLENAVHSPPRPE